MRVRVLFFGILKNIVGKAEDAVDVPEGASLRDVLVRYQRFRVGTSKREPTG